MKKILSILLIVMLSASFIPSFNLRVANAAEGSSEQEEYFVTPNTVDSRNKEGKYFILNEDGSYGGSYNDFEYGKGAPYNGEYDVENSNYFITDDYYNLPSTEERTLIPHFAPYQQTMQDTSGIACLLMVLNYMGYDVKNEYSEINLVKQYEKINNKEIYGNGTTPSGLKSLVDSLGLDWEVQTSGLDVSSKENSKASFIKALSEGKFVFIRWQAPKDFGWKVLIGYDVMGQVLNDVNKQMRDYVNDDIMILAEPYDGSDHFQDGYTIARTKEFYMWWLNMTTTGIKSDKYSYVVVDPKIEIDFNRQEKDTTIKQELYEINVPLNADGSYGGTRNKAKYGEITVRNGANNHLEANYIKHTDFYNMRSEGSRLLLEKYQVLQQTMGGSCGICSIGGAMKHLGQEKDTSYYDLELKLVESINKHFTINVNAGGIPSMNHAYEMCREWGYNVYGTCSSAGQAPRFSTYNQFIAMLKFHLSNDRPIVFGANPGSAHFVTVIGFDDMGTDYIYDDVIITADSCDYTDHYQDGYIIYPATAFYRHDTNGSQNIMQQYLVIYGKQ